MKHIIILLLLFIGNISEMSAQCTCNYNRLADILNNVEIDIVDYTTLQPVTSLSPGTLYRIKVIATDYYCHQYNPGGCDTAAPTAFYIKLADGLTDSNGNYIPPKIGEDVDSNWRGNIAVKTLTGGDFSSSVYVRVGALCSNGSNCTQVTSQQGDDALAILP